jgi:hypothetical protein
MKTTDLFDIAGILKVEGLALNRNSGMPGYGSITMNLSLILQFDGDLKEIVKKIREVSTEESVIAYATGEALSTIYSQEMKEELTC